ncbi:MAG: enoyl-CoA hydratase/isomerase family protein, partial [Myxococcota bacterium]
MHHREIDLTKPVEGVLYTKRDHVARITLDRPKRGNSLTPGMQNVFRAIWADVREDSEVRVAILSASGEKHFCTGFDVA